MGVSSVALVPSVVVVSATVAAVGLEFSTLLLASVVALSMAEVMRGDDMLGIDVISEISVDQPDGMAGEAAVDSPVEKHNTYFIFSAP